MPLVFGLNLTFVTFLFFAFLRTFPFGVTFRVQLLRARVLSVMVSVGGYH